MAGGKQHSAIKSYDAHRIANCARKKSRRRKTIDCILHLYVWAVSAKYGFDDMRAIALEFAQRRLTRAMQRALCTLASINAQTVARKKKKKEEQSDRNRTGYQVSKQCKEKTKNKKNGNNTRHCCSCLPVSRSAGRRQRWRSQQQQQRTKVRRQRRTKIDSIITIACKLQQITTSSNQHLFNVYGCRLRVEDRNENSWRNQNIEIKWNFQTFSIATLSIDVNWHLDKTKWKKYLLPWADLAASRHRLTK